MKLLIYTDNHFCENASVIRKFGAKYSQRIENQLRSLTWAEQLAVDKLCDTVICLGDFFDKPVLTDSELTAVRDIPWNNLPHIFLVGNHESSINGLAFSSTKALEDKNRKIISEPTILPILKLNNNVELCFLPYIIESDRKKINDYFGKAKTKRIILSHNDLKGIQLGPVESKFGFELQDIESSCDLFINGHLHNGIAITDKVINLGNLTGINFSEDATKYDHKVMILDTDTLQYEYIENPYAFNFYKLDINNAEDLAKINLLKQNAVLSIKCKASLVQSTRELINKSPNILESRIIITQDTNSACQEADIADLSVDHIAKFIECARLHFGTDQILEEELVEICK